MRILVIGGTGFIGPYVVRRLNEVGHDVTVFHRGQHEADLPPAVTHWHHPMLTPNRRAAFRDHSEELKRLAPDLVLDMIPATEQDAVALMEWVRGLVKRVVAISSGDVYQAYGRLHRKEPGLPDSVPLTEDSPLRQRLYPYRGESARAQDDPKRSMDDYDKILVERVVMGEPLVAGTILRLSAVYGPGDAQHRLFKYVKRMSDRRPAIILENLVAQWRWSRGYVENVADAIALAVSDRASGRIYNVGEEDALSQLEWIRGIARAMGWERDVIPLPTEKLAGQLRVSWNAKQHIIMDTSRIRRELGYAERVGREDALIRTVAWERTNPPEKIDPDMFDYATEDTILSEVGAH